MKSVQKLSIIAFIGLGAILMSWDSFAHRGLAKLGNAAVAFSKEANGLRVTVKKYSTGESKEYLDRNLIRHGYQPIQVTVENNTTRSYALSQDGISQPCASPGKVANSVSKKALPRSIGLKIASFFFWPLMIPSTIDGIFMLKTHAQMKKNYSAKAVKEESEEIAPYTTVSRVLFIPKKEVKDSLTVTLNSQDQSEAFSFTSLLAEDSEKVELQPIE